MRASLGSAAPGLGYKRDITETLRGALEINDYPRRSCSRSERMVHTVLSKIFCYRRDVALVLGAWPGDGGYRICIGTHCYSITTRKIFCHPHRLAYYVVMLRYFFRILFSSLCCAVISFVAGIFHEVLFDTFCF